MIIAGHADQLLPCTSISISLVFKVFHYHGENVITGLYQPRAFNTPDNNMVIINRISMSPTVKTFCIVTFDQVQPWCMREVMALAWNSRGLQHVAAYGSVLNHSWSWNGLFNVLWHCGASTFGYLLSVISW